MASKKLVALGFISTCFLGILWSLSQANNVSADSLLKDSSVLDSEDKVNLSMYYESLCPFCANFIVNHLVKIFQTELIAIVNLRLIPWGNTQISPNSYWICQHGPDECQMDVVEACATKEWPTVETHFKFIYCVETLHLMNRHTDWRQSCFGSTGLDPKPLEICHNNGLGHKLEKVYADETAGLNPRHRFVPWVVVNNQPLQEDFQRFVDYIFKAYRGNKRPQDCKSSSFEIEATSSTPQLEIVYADETAGLNPRHIFVPWVVVNNQPLQEDFQIFVDYICKDYRGNKMLSERTKTTFINGVWECKLILPTKKLCQIWLEAAVADWLFHARGAL